MRDSGWEPFKTPPKDSGLHERDAFKPLTLVYDEIIKSVPHLKATVKMAHNPHRTPLSARANRSGPDGTMELIERTSVVTEVEGDKCNWDGQLNIFPILEDIPVSMESKKHSRNADLYDVSTNLFIQTTSTRVTGL
jgi:hypothetical protein